VFFVRLGFYNLFLLRVPLICLGVIPSVWLFGFVLVIINVVVDDSIIEKAIDVDEDVGI
jgi:hypothetical protein